MQKKAPAKAPFNSYLHQLNCHLINEGLLDSDPYSLKYLSTALRISWFIVMSSLIPMNFKRLWMSGGITTVTRLIMPRHSMH